MSKILELIAGESLSIEDIVQDDGNDTPFPMNSTCEASAYNQYKKKIGNSVSGSRASESDPFKVVFSKGETANWDNNVAVVVTVYYEDGITAASEKIYIKVEKFG